ncbi:ribonucleoside-triphosphate reductase, adenosylcobalamin-dependent [bacterium]|nr:ribonucleoside-triphosphate reductase, adenosylcobalamin-dependent [bacterium]
MIKVLKRGGSAIDFDVERIVNAIYLASTKSINGPSHELAKNVGKKVKAYIFKHYDETITVEKVQDIVEHTLMDSDRKDVAKEYILYRGRRTHQRNLMKDGDVAEVRNLITKDFLAKYKHSPSPMGALGSFVYYRTYSRFLDKAGRREEWWETVARAVEYNCGLLPGVNRKEAEDLYDNIFNLRQFLSGRTFWVGGTDVARKFPTGNYNCAFTVIDDMESFTEAFYLLMVGSGVGFRALKRDVAKLPRVRTNIEVIHEQYTSEPEDKRHETTSLSFNESGLMVRIKVGDSKEGWSMALRFFLELTYAHHYRHVRTVVLDYNSVRKRGEKLRTFGGTASGHTAVQDMLKKIDKIIKSAGARDLNSQVKMRPIDVIDIMNIMGECVVVGGVRRTAELGLIDASDGRAIKAKNDLYFQDADGKWVQNKEVAHRQMSNNSIFYEAKPTREKLTWHMKQLRYSGEPGFINAEAARKRREDFEGVNPCAEILLADKGLCNLTTNNAMAFVVTKKGKKKNDPAVVTFDRAKWLRAFELSVRSGYRMSAVSLELSGWDNVQQRDRLLGVSITGWQDMVNATNMSFEDQAELLRATREHTHIVAEKYAAEKGTNPPKLVTTLKPEGSLSQLPTVSSGLHFNHSPFYVRRVRISKTDVLAKVCGDLGYPVEADVTNNNNLVIEFPVKAPAGRTKYDVTAIEQMELYKMFMESYVDHNASITVHVREHEWEDVEQWLWDNWDSVVAISFLSLDDNFYQQAPYEKISEEEYLERVAKMKPMVPSLIAKYETEAIEFELATDECENGICPVR